MIIISRGVSVLRPSFKLPDPGRLPKGEKGKEAGYGFLLRQGEVHMSSLQSPDVATDRSPVCLVNARTV